ncbi:hypothetical protein NMY22_g15109 [Coprinellus aureogranulatus]|nr:hypothetical protein NMY22_g15109 [Coprinellus aureogranulatus]
MASFRPPRVRSGSKKSAPEPPPKPSMWTEDGTNVPIRDRNYVIFDKVNLQSTSGGALLTIAESTTPQRPIQISTHRPRTPSPVKKRVDARTKQLQNWTRVIEELVPKYLSLLRSTENLRNPPSTSSPCSCPQPSVISVSCIGFTDVRVVDVCSCASAQHLLSLGFFPCAPIRPSIAFDLRLLRFLQELHCRTSPNITAFTGALESTLLCSGFSFKGQDSVRRKLGKALQFYSVLVAKTDAYVPQEDLPAGNYLSRCCPLCFGGEMLSDDTSSPIVIVCIDACFTHKRRRPARGSGNDAAITLPRTVFLTVAEVEAARILVESARPNTTHAQPSAKSAKDQSDNIEPGMKIPPSVLDACNESFTAADEKRQKASTQFFIDTGLMAILCRHDQVLWLVNMTTPGERQFYAIALITKLFESIPDEVNVGILYDIGCQLDRSCRKWDFLSPYSDRILWGISIFHAYGHQWPCQLVYHPRKTSGFGLSDGEGCERFWSAIQHLIPSLRVSGYHTRILKLDLQAAWLQQQNLQHFGQWVTRKSIACQEKLAGAKSTLQSIKIREAVLRSQWELQLQEQTKPLVAATAGLSKKSIKAILGLLDYSQSLDEDRVRIDGLLENPATFETDDIDDLLSQRMELLSKKTQVSEEIQRRRGDLGVSEEADLKSMMGDKYLQARMQAKALRDRIQSKLRNRKFELERLNRVYHMASAGAPPSNHVSGQFSRSQPGIINLLKKYNTLCAKIEGMVTAQTAPPGVAAPKPLDRQTLFALDVDDAIWLDPGLTDMVDEVPPWLGDEKTREGIKALLLQDRCLEELQHLQREVDSMVHWFSYEWERLESALDDFDDDDLLWYIQSMQDDLSRLGTKWYQDLASAVAVSVPSDWGSFEPHLSHTGASKPVARHSAHGQSSVEDDSDGSGSEMGVDGVEDTLLQELELLNFAEERPGVAFDDRENLFKGDSSILLPQRSVAVAYWMLSSNAI